MVVYTWQWEGKRQRERGRKGLGREREKGGERPVGGRIGKEEGESEGRRSKWERE